MCKLGLTGIIYVQEKSNDSQDSKHCNLFRALYVSAEMIHLLRLRHLYDIDLLQEIRRIIIHIKFKIAITSPRSNK